MAGGTREEIGGTNTVAPEWCWGFGPEYWLEKHMKRGVGDSRSRVLPILMNIWLGSSRSTTLLTRIVQFFCITWNFFMSIEHSLCARYHGTCFTGMGSFYTHIHSKLHHVSSYTRVCVWMSSWFIFYLLIQTQSIVGRLYMAVLRRH